MLSPKPLTARFRSKLLGSRPPDWRGFKRELINPGSVIDHVQSVTLADEYERIKGSLFPLVLSDEIKTARGGPVNHPATFAYELGKSVIADGSVYYRGGHLVLGKGLSKPFAFGKPDRVDQAVLCNSSITEQFFGHWLLDAPPLMVLAEERDMIAIAARTPFRPQHRLDYTASVGVPLVDTRLAIVDNLWFVNDTPTNLGRGERLREVRRRVRQGASGSAKRVILDRKLGGVRRNLTNSTDIWKMLEREFGFETIDPLQLSQRELVEALCDAQIIVSVEGSALAHAVIAASEGATIFAIMPPSRFCMAIKWYTDIVGMGFGFAVADGSDSDFAVPVDRMRRAISLVEERRSA